MALTRSSAWDTGQYGRSEAAGDMLAASLQSRQEEDAVAKASGPKMSPPDGCAAVMLVADFSGTRNGMDWPKSGSAVYVPAQEAADMKAARLAVDVPKDYDGAEAVDLTANTQENPPPAAAEK